MSFLNIGSGTGYFSTMAGFLIGPYGINHGIEIYQENIEYACDKLESFKAHSEWYDPVEFCDPVFLHGNGLLLSPNNILYDRIYCGAACPLEHAQLMKNMLKVGGILVMPHDNQVRLVSCCEPVLCICVTSADEVHRLFNHICMTVNYSHTRKYVSVLCTCMCRIP